MKMSCSVPSFLFIQQPLSIEFFLSNCASSIPTGKVKHSTVFKVLFTIVTAAFPFSFLWFYLESRKSKGGPILFGFYSSRKSGIIRLQKFAMLAHKLFWFSFQNATCGSVDPRPHGLRSSSKPDLLSQVGNSSDPQPHGLRSSYKPGLLSQVENSSGPRPHGLRSSSKPDLLSQVVNTNSSGLRPQCPQSSSKPELLSQVRNNSDPRPHILWSLI